jgi:hypothetical protein
LPDLKKRTTLHSKKFMQGLATRSGGHYEEEISHKSGEGLAFDNYFYMFAKFAFLDLAWASTRKAC